MCIRDRVYQGRSGSEGVGELTVEDGGPIWTKRHERVELRCRADEGRSSGVGENKERGGQEGHSPDRRSSSFGHQRVRLGKIEPGVEDPNGQCRMVKGEQSRGSGRTGHQWTTW